ncbi:hypothetical protein OIU74_021090 [Salix koriyanagi]|uniref:Uncharacterized protein n=1 Tax=Salix koriyanagi TaxID=2511006 RepID=A0A9Q0P833_9ROSI|nr:hypothetical protein OIU74_021090 [Salix koriyanagi]
MEELKPVFNLARSIKLQESIVFKDDEDERTKTSKKSMATTFRPSFIPLRKSKDSAIHLLTQKPFLGRTLTLGLPEAEVRVGTGQ